MTTRFWRTQALVAVALGIACSPGEQSGDPATGVGEGESEVLRQLHLEPNTVEAWGIEVAPVATTSVTAEIVLPGILAVNENRTANIAPLLAGQIAELHVDLGSRVWAGQVLASLNAPEFTKAQTDFMRAFAQAELSRNDFERATALRDRQAIEEREFLRRQSIHEQNLAEMRAAEVTLHSLGIDEDGIQAIAWGVDASVPARDHRAVEPLLPVRSPITGVVTARDAILGDHVEHGRSVFTVSDLSVLWARLDAYENQLGFLDPAGDVVVRADLLPGQDFPGRITFIADNVDEELRTVRVRAEVPNPGNVLKPNMYVQGFIRVTDDDAEVLVVPQEAVQILDGRSVVFVREPPRPGEDHLVYDVREVVTGETLSEGRIILEGLRGDEMIVTTGAFSLKAEITKGAAGDEHVH